MTILNYFTEKSGLEVIGCSSVWNYHGIDSLFNVAMKKGSNLNSSLAAIKKSGYEGIVTLYVTSIGRSQHSASTVHIFKGVVNSNSMGSDAYSKRTDEVRLDIFNA